MDTARLARRFYRSSNCNGDRRRGRSGWGERGRAPPFNAFGGDMTITVLIVDDSKLARIVAAKALTVLQPDWARQEASNAEEALAAIAGGTIDVALLDFNMPGRDGLDLAAEI